MPGTINNLLDRLIGPVTAEEEAEFDREYGAQREDAEEVQEQPKKKTRGPGRKNRA